MTEVPKSSASSTLAQAVTMVKSREVDVFAFYGATLLSSIGSMTFTVCLTAFMLKAGQSLAMVGVALAVNRLVPLVVNLMWGDIGDRVNPRRLIAWTEVAAALLSLGLLWTWEQGPGAFWIFLAILATRSCLVVLQGGARARMVKLLSDSSYSSNARQAIWLNKATHGATLFGGAIGWFLVSYATFIQAILFDMTTFALGGLALWFLRIEMPTMEQQPRAPHIFFKFKSLYHFAQRPAALDLLLALTMCGTGTLMARLAGGNQGLIPLFLISYGAAVWIAGYLQRLSFIQLRHESLWILLGIAYLAAFASVGHPTVTLPLILVKDIAYWLLFHRYSAQIQSATPSQSMAAVSSARTVQMVVVLSLGELGVGFWQTIVSPLGEGAWRAAICMIIAIVLSLPQLQVEKERANDAVL
ncbi:MAG: hypothetical protein NTV34_17855 [Proteobacteria bacterium]|nr:hypothetical protein [Pseudomonadota bacterium]